jgi:hypothetical protein
LDRVQVEVIAAAAANPERAKERARGVASLRRSGSRRGRSPDSQRQTSIHFTPELCLNAVPTNRLFIVWMAYAV